MISETLLLITLSGSRIFIFNVIRHHAIDSKAKSYNVHVISIRWKYNILTSKALNQNSFLTIKEKHGNWFALQGRESLESSRKLFGHCSIKPNNKTFQCTHIYTPTSTNTMKYHMDAEVYMCFLVCILYNRTNPKNLCSDAYYVG